MIENVETYAALKEIPSQDALQVFMQVVALKNIHPKKARLIGGTALVIGFGNPRFSEDIDLTGVADPKNLEPAIKRTCRELEGFLGGTIRATPPKEGRCIWRIACRLEEKLGARLHIDTQPYPPLSHHPLMIEYPGISPFVFPSIELNEILADKLIALAFRNNVSGRDIFDLWYHWLKQDFDTNQGEQVKKYIQKKLKLRSLSKTDFQHNIKTRMKTGITKRVIDEWKRYLPRGLKDNDLYGQIFSIVERYASKVTV